jgi:hypothetical protein
VIVACAFAQAAVDIRVVFDQAQRIAGLFFAPAKTTADYLDNVTLNEGAMCSMLPR